MENQTFADYILSEKDWIKKMEIMYYLNKRGNVYFDNSVVFKTELLKLFLDNTPELNFDENMLITACLLCNCKKVDNFTDLNKIRTYAKDGADYLETLGFDKRFCKICEQVNRYTGSEPREPEADVLELIDQFGGMLLDRPERIGFKVDEALVLLEHRNLKNEYNRYLESFREFAQTFDKVYIQGVVNTTVFARLQKLVRESKDVPEFVDKLSVDYSVTVDQKIVEVLKNTTVETENKSLFTNETKEKILKHIE